MLADSNRREPAGTVPQDCVISVLPPRAGLGPAEHRALRALADAGLIPPPPGQAAATPGQAAAPPARPARHIRPAATSRPGMRRVKTRPSVGDSVETTLARR